MRPTLTPKSRHGWPGIRDISANRIKRDSFTSVAELDLAIDLCIQHHNADPKPFIGMASAIDVLAKVVHSKAALIGASK